MLQKIIRFVKENLVAVVGIAAIAISLLLILIPGQFVNLVGYIAPKEDRFMLNAYEFFFNSKVINGETIHPGYLVPHAVLADEAIVVPAGIAIFVLMALTIVALVFHKKSSILPLLAGLLLIATAVLFYAMEASVVDIYGIKLQNTDVVGKATNVGTVGWTCYFSASLILLAGAYAIYKGVLMMKDEIKHPVQSKAAPSYNYLKK